MVYDYEHEIKKSIRNCKMELMGLERLLSQRRAVMEPSEFINEIKEFRNKLNEFKDDELVGWLDVNYLGVDA